MESPTKEREVETPPFGAPHVFVLASISGRGNPGVHRIRARETVVGRAADADLVLTDEEVSKKLILLTGRFRETARPVAAAPAG